MQKTGGSPRKRSNCNFHELHEVCQRFLNVLLKDTYVQPHIHKNPPKPETFLVIKGELGFLTFDYNENVITRHRLSEKGPIYGIDIQPGVWHISETCICFEGKSGPYDPSVDKMFADWAPTEQDESSFIVFRGQIKTINIGIFFIFL
ncbi:MAG TPA: WbuC family cupin fold metalloprotein [Leptospiraceae bacterium]|nr:WbuC family cupin fold metalloprotein [Leptospiraceae bacterium]HMY69910.1 WbuC family cupin fold metalloprotein [Leptospiraceae bacterium]HNF14107.1 WbuC family cupin fold metalloprotein [Leptospiraceae bacterium]HNF27258.1 WbuC family cupin fold metalloprotein [Leptospiraceae bacterium]HNI95478.1 WbuC family cupin fold metalloprotein [Leptospiraceae bacterium]